MNTVMAGTDGGQGRHDGGRLIEGEERRGEQGAVREMRVNGVNGVVNDDRRRRGGHETSRLSIALYETCIQQPRVSALRVSAEKLPIRR